MCRLRGDDQEIPRIRVYPLLLKEQATPAPEYEEHLKKVVGVDDVPEVIGVAADVDVAGTVNHILMFD